MRASGWILAASVALFLGASLGPQTTLQPNENREDVKEFSRLFERVGEPDFRSTPIEERRDTFEDMLVLAEAFDERAKAENGKIAAYVVRELGTLLRVQGDVVGALNLLSEGKEAWAEYVSSSWIANIVVAEAEALDWLGVQDQADRLHREAVTMVDADLRDPENLNVGIYFNAHFESIRHKIRGHRFQAAHQELEEFESSIDWDFMERRIGEPRVLGNIATLMLLRGGSALELDSAHQAEARDVLYELVDWEGARPGLRLRAGLNLAWMHLRDDQMTQARAVVERVSSLRDQVGETSPEYVLFAELGLASHLVATATPEERPARLEHLAEAHLRFLEFRRTNPLSTGTAASRYRDVRLAVDALMEALEGDQLLDFLILNQSTGRLWRELGKPSPTAEQLKGSLLDRDTGCLVYVRGGLRDSWIAVSPGGDVERFTVPRFLTWTADARLYDESIAQDPANMLAPFNENRERTLERLNGVLSRLLFPPELVRELATWKRVLLVGRDDLEGIFLEAIPAGDRPLGLSHTVTELPSLPVGFALRQRGASPDARGVKVVADPAVHDRLAELQLAGPLGLRADRLRESLGLEELDQVELVLHDDAQASSLSRTRREGLIQVIAHGFRDPYRGRGTLLAMTPGAGRQDGLVGIDTVREMRVAPTVLLSVCHAGDTPVRSGDAGASHLGGAFLEAGASTVLLAPTTLRLDAVYALSSPFHRSWKQGMDASQALHSARNELAEGELADPYYWATTRVFGVDR